LILTYKEKALKKQVIIALTICVLILSACTVAKGTTPVTSSSVSHASANTLSACSALQEQQVQLQKAVDAASMQLSSAHGDLRKAEQARNELIKLHEPTKLVQAELKMCPSAG
jgi:hypothetical protein